MKAETVQRMIGEAIPEMKRLMATGATDWQQLSKEDLESLQVISHRVLEEIDVKKARSHNVITREQFETIKAFWEFMTTLGGHDD